MGTPKWSLIHQFLSHYLYKIFLQSVEPANSAELKAG